MCQEKHHSLSGSIVCNTSDRFLPREMAKKKTNSKKSLWLSVIWALGKAECLRLSCSVPDHWKLVTAQSLIMILEDWQEQKQPRFRSMGCSCCHLTLRMTTVCEERQLKQRKKTEGLCRMRFVTPSMFPSLEYNPFTLYFHQLLLCAEPGRIWPSSPKTGVALMGSNTECVIIREGAFFKP